MIQNKLGIILAGGSGTRLKPLTHIINKHLLPVFDKPMIYYPISTLMQAGIKDIIIITSPQHLNSFKALLGDGDQFGINLQYRVQEEPGGIPQAFQICIDSILNKEVWLILGDNIFFGQGFTEHLQRPMSSDAQIFALKVRNPSDFGVIELDDYGNPIKIVEKPAQPLSELASVGLYRYRHGLEETLRLIKPSGRGELEITDINNLYLEQLTLELNILGRGLYWCDAGTPDRLLDAGHFIKLAQHSNNYIIGCPEEIGLNAGWLDPAVVVKKFRLNSAKTAYERYILQVAQAL